jgi:flagellar hook-basal body complex protein FliE
MNPNIPLEKLNLAGDTYPDNNPTEMANPKTIDEQLADVKRFNEALRTQLKKVNEELTAARNNQRTLIDLLADTMKRLREAEAALEEEKKKPSPLLPLLQRAARRDPWRSDIWEQGARAYEALLAHPCEARAWDAPAQSAAACGGSEEPTSTVQPTISTQPALTQPPLSDEDLYA